MENSDSKIEGMLSDVLNEETGLKKIFLSAASAVLAASIIGSIVLYKEFIHIQDWAKHHENTASMHIGRITKLEEKSNLGTRWTLEDHNKYAAKLSDIGSEYNQRISILERSKDLTDFKLETMDDKLDEIIEAISNVTLGRGRGRGRISHNPMEGGM